jgi:tetratricopeptide (TPR) repeat protein
MNYDMRNMVLKYCFLFLFLTLIQTVQAQTAALQDSISQAAKYYNAGKYNDAIRTYQFVLGEGYESSVLYFNLGNAFYKAGNSTYAILNYQRAKKLTPNDEDINYNLDMARRQIVDNIVTLPEPGFLAWGRQLISLRSANQWGLHSIVAFFTFLILFGIFLLSRAIRIKRMSFWLAVFTFVYSSITYSFGTSVRNRMLHHNSAVITERSLRVKGSPSETGTELFIIHEGLTVQLTDKLGDWVEIRLPDGNKGWVKESTLVRI